MAIHESDLEKNYYYYYYYYYASHGLLILEVSILHTTTHHSR
jgi:hypothetical protein